MRTSARVHGPCSRRRFWHAWTREPVCTTRVHGPWTRVMWTGARVHGPCSRPTFLTSVNTGACLHYPCSWAMNTGICPHYPCSWPMNTGNVDRRLYSWPMFMSTFLTPVNTGACPPTRVHGPWSWVVRTGLTWYISLIAASSLNKNKYMYKTYSVKPTIPAEAVDSGATSACCCASTSKTSSSCDSLLRVSSDETEFEDSRIKPTKQHVRCTSVQNSSLFYS